MLIPKGGNSRGNRLMEASEQELYQRIEAFSIDAGGEALTFCSRLARENGWSPSFAARVIDEYKRFVFLAMVAGHPVTPSDQVDQAWHLHLTYTRSYWDQLCAGVLKRPLHHGPTQGGPGESDKFNDWYQRTLESYQRIFGEAPPADIWPPASIRFGEGLHYQRVNTMRTWLLAKSRVTSVAGGLLLGCLAIGALVALRRPAAATPDWLQLASQEIFVGVAALLSLTLILYCLILRFCFGKRCPNCKQREAYDKTGRSMKGGMFSPRKDEWHCGLCEHSEWKARSLEVGYGGCGSDGGGDGDSGCGGGCGGD